ncbi:MAG: hypothetical protein Q4C50_05475 [Eubacteriales bacterium]|nr:hypothetical protein [Eubacteriales bacterium]
MIIQVEVLIDELFFNPNLTPTNMLGLGWAATAVSTGVAVVFCKMMDRRKRKAN